MRTSLVAGGRSLPLLEAERWLKITFLKRDKAGCCSGETTAGQLKECDVVQKSHPRIAVYPLSTTYLTDL